MFRLSTLLPMLLASSVFSAMSADTAPAADKDPLRDTLLESRDKKLGVTLHASGAVIAMVLTAIDERHVVGRSQQASRIVVRLDRIDAVSAAF